jgi:HK97 gp10 family phage protein
MMAEQFVTGMSKVVSQLIGITDSVRKQIVEIVEQNAVRAANHAKEDHFHGQAHAVGRYENQTGNLTNSIIASDARVSQGVVEATVSTNKEYAPKVEFGTPRTNAYPFMQPAIAATEPKFVSDLRALRIGG